MGRRKDGPMTNAMVVSEDEAYELLAQLVCSAELGTVEPYYYGTFRLLDAASRLMECMLRHQSNGTRDWLEAFKAELDQNKLLMMSDRPGYFRYLEQVGGRVAEGVKLHLARSSS
jgi:Family of unknown function (DUF6092)